MKPVDRQISNWIFYAKDDLWAAERMLESGIFHLVCFHSQQCTEKILKALILKQEDTVPRTHNLIKLMERVEKIEKRILDFKEELGYLNDFYVSTRYPDAFAGSLPEGLPTKEDAQKAVEIARKIFDFGKKILLK